MKVIIHPIPEKELKKLPRDIASAIVKKLDIIKEDPLHYIERLKASHLWKLRIGDYRCILFIHSGKQEIHILKLGHRKNIYQQLE